MKGRDKKSVKKIEMDPDDQLRKLGKRIKTLRIERGYSSYETFAYEHNISRAQVGRYEQGKDIRFSTLVKVLNALEVSLEEFFGKGFE